MLANVVLVLLCANLTLMCSAERVYSNDPNLAVSWREVSETGETRELSSKFGGNNPSLPMSKGCLDKV